MDAELLDLPVVVLERFSLVVYPDSGLIRSHDGSDVLEKLSDSRLRVQQNGKRVCSDTRDLHKDTNLCGTFWSVTSVLSLIDS